MLGCACTSAGACGWLLAFQRVEMMAMEASEWRGALQAGALRQFVVEEGRRTFAVPHPVRPA